MRVVAIDGGKSGLRVRIASTDSGERVTGTGPGSSYTGDVGHDLRSLLGAIDAAVDEAMPIRAAGPVADIACVGLTGLPGDAAERRELVGVLHRVLAPRLLLADDGVLAHAGALGRPGTVASIGTGTIVTTVDGEGRTRTTDAWGPDLGDRGSAFALGNAGLRAAAAASDGTAPATLLCDRAAEVLGSWPPSLAELQRFYRDPARVALTAGFAPAVLQLAAEGDPVAVLVRNRAAEDIAATLRAAAAPGLPIVWTGRIAAQGVGYGEEILRALGPDLAARVLPPEGDSLDGGIRIAVEATSGDGLYRASVESWSGGLS